MEKLLNSYDKECMKMAMLKHEEAFREQVYELHRLYRIQKILMKDVSKPRVVVEERSHNTPQYRAEPYLRAEFERPVIDQDDQADLELTLGSRSYSQRKPKPGRMQDSSGPGYSSSSSGSGKRTRSSLTRDHELSGEQRWGVDQMAVPNQDKLNNCPPWLFQALSLNMT